MSVTVSAADTAPYCFRLRGSIFFFAMALLSCVSHSSQVAWDIASPVNAQAAISSSRIAAVLADAALRTRACGSPRREPRNTRAILRGVTPIYGGDYRAKTSA